MHVGLADRHLEINDLPAAITELERARDFGEHAGLPQEAYRWRVVMAGIREAEGDLAAAIDLLDEAERLYVADFLPAVRPVPAVRARTFARHGHLTQALEWPDTVDLTLDDSLNYLREFEHLTLAKVLIAQHQHCGVGVDLPRVVGFLDRLLAAANEAKRCGSVIDIEVTRALALQECGDTEQAMSSIAAALDLAEVEGYVRTFIAEGAPMATLLTAVDRRRSSPYVTRLRAALAATDRGGRAGAGETASGGLVEPLSSREQDVLRLLDTELNGPDIARELVVSLNTVRTHTKNLYMKLGVSSRRAAVARAKELQLL